MVFNGNFPTEDFHLISSCPCRAYTKPSTRTLQNGASCGIRCAQFCHKPPHFAGPVMAGVMFHQQSSSQIPHRKPIEDL